jgi:hypothetical protein
MSQIDADSIHAAFDGFAAFEGEQVKGRVADEIEQMVDAIERQSAAVGLSGEAQRVFHRRIQEYLPADCAADCHRVATITALIVLKAAQLELELA